MSKLFSKYHYDALAPNKAIIDTVSVRREREQVRDQFLWLDSHLAPYIESQDWDLHRHHQKQHYTSSTHFIWINKSTGEVRDEEGIEEGYWHPVVTEIGWLWLHYGKSLDQRNYYKNLPGVFQYSKYDDSDYINAFYAHMRIQFYLSCDNFGVWLISTDKDRYDRSEFLKALQSKKFQDEYWELLKPLFNKGFVYRIEEEEFPINGKDKEDLFKFIRTGRARCYSGIRKLYDPEDSALEIENIVEEMKENLRLLYPLYLKMTHRPVTETINKTSFDPTKLFGGVAKVRKS